MLLQPWDQPMLLQPWDQPMLLQPWDQPMLLQPWDQPMLLQPWDQPMLLCCNPNATNLHVTHSGPIAHKACRERRGPHGSRGAQAMAARGREARWERG